MHPIPIGRDSGYLQTDRQAEVKSGAHTFLALRPDSSAMPFHNLPGDRQAHACPFYIASMQALKQAEDPFRKLLVEPAPIVSDGEDPVADIALGFDPQTRTFAWRYPQAGDTHGYGGVMTTAAGLVFFADNQGFFEAADASTGKSLWHFNTGQSLHASPMSYAVSGAQYVAIASGSDLFSFALPR